MLINYNTTPWHVIKGDHLIPSLIIPSPKASKDPDVYMAPLIENLVDLWEVGVPTFDVNRPRLEDGQQFQMKAIMIWTITDGAGSLSTIYSF